MRPDEYAATQADRWIEAVQLRNAIDEGRSGARSEKQAADAAMAMSDG
jgi:hypothetical protein